MAMTSRPSRIVPDSGSRPVQEKHIKKDSMFTAKAQRCHGHVEGKVSNPYAVCNASLGKRKAYRKYQR